MDNKLHNILQRAEQVSGVFGLAERLARKSKPEQAPINENRYEEKQPTIARQHSSGRSGRAKDAYRKKIRLANLRIVAKLRKRFEGRENAIPKVIPANLWIDAQIIVSDATGRAVRAFAHQTDNKIALARIHRAALAIDNDGRAQYDYAGDSVTSCRARRVFALGYLMLRLSRGTRRRGQWNRLLAGITQRALITAISDPYNSSRKKLARTTVTGRHRRVGQAGEIGYLDALKRSGFCYTRQAKWRGADRPNLRGWHDIRDNEIAGCKNGLYFSTARYWIITERFSEVSDIDCKRQLWADWSAGCQPTESWIARDVHGKTSGFCPLELLAKPPD